jgi:hypothetical protein
MSYSVIMLPVPSREGVSAQQEESSSSSSAGATASLFPHLALQTKFGNKLRATGPQISPNDILYPQVLAGEHLFFWTSALELELWLQLVQSTPPLLLIKYDDAIAAQWSTDTNIGYGSGIKKWISFCDKHNIAPKFRLPASRQWLLSCLPTVVVLVLRVSPASCQVSMHGILHRMCHGTGTPRQMTL